MSNLFRRCSGGRLVRRSFSQRGSPRSTTESDACGMPAGVYASGYRWFAMLHHKRYNVKIDEAILRIKNFDVVTHRSATLCKRSPIETSNAFVQPFPDRFAS